MKHLARIALLALLSSAIMAEEFYLRHDASGKLMGPFSTEDGSKVKLGKTTFTVENKKPELSEAEQYLADLIIPRIAFMNASTKDVLFYLQMNMREMNPKTKQVNFVFMPPASKPKKPGQPNRTNDPFPDGFGMGIAHQNSPKITMDLNNVSTLQALKIIMEQSGCTYKVDGLVIIVFPPREVDKAEATEKAKPTQASSSDAH